MKKLIIPLILIAFLVGCSGIENSNILPLSAAKSCDLDTSETLDIIRCYDFGNSFYYGTVDFHSYTRYPVYSDKWELMKGGSCSVFLNDGTIIEGIFANTIDCHFSNFPETYRSEINHIEYKIYFTDFVEPPVDFSLSMVALLGVFVILMFLGVFDPK